MPLPYLAPSAPAPITDSYVTRPPKRRLVLAYWCSECKAYVLSGACARNQRRPLACGHSVSSHREAALVTARGVYAGRVPKDGRSLRAALMTPRVIEEDEDE